MDFIDGVYYLSEYALPKSYAWIFGVIVIWLTLSIIFVMHLLYSKMFSSTEKDFKIATITIGILLAVWFVCVMLFTITASTGPTAYKVLVDLEKADMNLFCSKYQIISTDGSIYTITLIE